MSQCNPPQTQPLDPHEIFFSSGFGLGIWQKHWGGHHRPTTRGNLGGVQKNIDDGKKIGVKPPPSSGQSTLVCSGHCLLGGVLGRGLRGGGHHS